MNSFRIPPHFRPAILATAVATLLTGASTRASDFTVTILNGDTDSGINSALNYTSVADFDATSIRTVNGVTFNDTGVTGGNYALGGTFNDFTGRANNLTGGLNGLVSDFKYNGDGTGNASLTLSGLTPGTQYVTSWYNQSFGNGTGRYVDITPSDTSSVFRFNEDSTRNGDGNVLRYAFTATATSITYNFDAVSNPDSFHFYAMTNAVRNDSLFSYTHFTPIAPVITEVSGQNNPFVVSNTDLLQTSVASMTSSGNFAREPVTGDQTILNNGAFSITGIGFNNPELTTGENNASVTYNLNVSVNTLGYDVTSIVGYGGWNDAGRDNQHYSIFYSVVGSAAFTLLGSVDDNPASPGTLSAIKAVFNTSLSGVDAIRVDFLNAQENGFVGYGEIDAIGTATVPEPGTALSLLGGVGMLLGFRRRRKH